MVWNVGWDAEVVDFGGGDFWRVIGKRVVAWSGKVGGDKNFAVSGGALGGVSAARRSAPIRR
jgi:hypothetical protein